MKHPRACYADAPGGHYEAAKQARGELRNGYADDKKFTRRKAKSVADVQKLQVGATLN